MAEGPTPSVGRAVRLGAPSEGKGDDAVVSGTAEE